MAQQRIWPQYDRNTPVSWPSRLGEYEKRLLFEIAELSTVFILHAIVRLFRRQWRHFRRPTTSGVKARRRGGGAAAAAGRCRCEWQRQRQREVAAWLDPAVGHAGRRPLDAVAECSPPWRHHNVIYKTMRVAGRFTHLLIVMPKQFDCFICWSLGSYKKLHSGPIKRRQRTHDSNLCSFWPIFSSSCERIISKCYAARYCTT